MTGKDDARYRLALAARSLESCDRDLGEARWREAALFARAAIEHATKATLACFGTIPKTHEPKVPLAAAIADPRFPAALLARATTLVASVESYGLEEHVMLSYGDEKKHIDPWSLVTEGHARESSRVAHEALDVARACIDTVFGG